MPRKITFVSTELCECAIKTTQLDMISSILLHIRICFDNLKDLLITLQSIDRDIRLENGYDTRGDLTVENVLKISHESQFALFFLSFIIVNQFHIN